MSGGDPYSDGGVLRNKLGIRDPDELSRAEYDITHAKILTLAARPIEGRFDLDHLRAIHKRIFSDVYDWAGELRTVSISKGTSPFAFPQFLEPAGHGVFTKLAAEDHLKGLDDERFVARAAYFHGEINALHPFREGNGRATRAFLDQLAAETGRRFDWHRVSESEHLRASIASFDGDLEPMRQVFRQIVRHEPTAATTSASGGSPAVRRPPGAQLPRASRAGRKRTPGREPPKPWSPPRGLDKGEGFDR